MKAKRVLIALALAVTGGIGVSAAMASPSAALTLPYKSCQTVDAYTDFASNGSNEAEGWQFQLRQRVTGCWTDATGQSTWTTYQATFVGAWQTDYLGYYDTVSSGAAGLSQSVLYNAASNPTYNYAGYQVAANRTICNPALYLLLGVVFCSPTEYGTYYMYQDVVLTPTVVSQNGGWSISSGCYLATGSDVSGGCVAGPSWIDYYQTTFYYPDTPTPTPTPAPTPTPGQTFPRPGTCSLTAKQNAPIYQAAGSGYSRWLADAMQGTQLWVSRSSQLHSQTYFLPILTGTFTGKLIPMSDITIWGGSYWNGTCYT